VKLKIQEDDLIISMDHLIPKIKEVDSKIMDSEKDIKSFE